MTFLPILRRRLAAMATVAGGAFLMFALLPVAQAARVEETVALPVKVDLRHQETLSQTMHVGIFRDDSATGPQPFLILGHGRPANGNFANFRVDGYRKQIEASTMHAWLGIHYSFSVPRLSDDHDVCTTRQTAPLPMVPPRPQTYAGGRSAAFR